MKNNLDYAIEKIIKENRVGLMTHVVTGYPSLALSKKIIRTLVKNGSDIIEIQIPFSDPMADGQLIVEACQKSLENGLRIKDSFELANFVKENFDVPVVIMTYANIIMHMGMKRFCTACQKNKVSGLIVPDLPYDSEECKKLRKYALESGIHLIYVVSPAVESKRLKEIKKLASGFLYCTSRQGTTGTGKSFAKSIGIYLTRVKGASSLPLAVGFGISSAKNLKLIKKHAQIGIIGSAIIDVINKHKISKILPALDKFMTNLKE